MSAGTRTRSDLPEEAGHIARTRRDTLRPGVCGDTCVPIGHACPNAPSQDRQPEGGTMTTTGYQRALDAEPALRGIVSIWELPIATTRRDHD